jgi:hypothetical protein
MLAIIFHEASHAILHGRLKNIAPRWLDEGLAEFFEYGRERGGRLVMGVQEHKARRVRTLLEKSETFQLAKYFQLTEKEWLRLDKTEDRLTSSMAWSLVTFLMSHEEGRALLRAMLRYVDRDGQEELEDVVGSSYPGGIPGWERAWRRYCLENREKPQLSF